MLLFLIDRVLCFWANVYVCTANLAVLTVGIGSPNNFYAVRDEQISSADFSIKKVFVRFSILCNYLIPVVIS